MFLDFWTNGCMDKKSMYNIASAAWNRATICGIDQKKRRCSTRGRDGLTLNAAPPEGLLSPRPRAGGTLLAEGVTRMLFCHPGTSIPNLLKFTLMHILPARKSRRSHASPLPVSLCLFYFYLQQSLGVYNIQRHVHGTSCNQSFLYHTGYSPVNTITGLSW